LRFALDDFRGLSTVRGTPSQTGSCLSTGERHVPWNIRPRGQGRSLSKGGSRIHRLVRSNPRPISSLILPSHRRGLSRPVPSRNAGIGAREDYCACNRGRAKPAAAAQPRQLAQKSRQRVPWREGGAFWEKPGRPICSRLIAPATRRDVPSPVEPSNQPTSTSSSRPFPGGGKKSPHKNEGFRAGETGGWGMGRVPRGRVLDVRLRPRLTASNEHRAKPARESPRERHTRRAPAPASRSRCCLAPDSGVAMS
jgi:hypothetical protein